MKWPETVIATAQGKKTALAPFVISASRATDIPAFHAQWFMNRLRAGYCLWQNPFNACQKRYISFERCAAIVFWSKNPQNLLPYLHEIEARGCQFYIHFTLNNYEKEGLEPNIPSLARRIASFQEISSRIGRERVIWRFDPIIMGTALSVEAILERLQQLAAQLAPYTGKLVFSFLDIYRKAAARLKILEPGYRAPTEDEMLRLASGIAMVNRALKTPLALSCCAENLDLRQLGVEKGRCIDPELLLRLCPSNPDIQRLCQGGRQQKLEVLGSSALPGAAKPVKDRGQRAACGCAPSKDIGRYSTCGHLCAYCYANGSQAEVQKRLIAARENWESL